MNGRPPPAAHGEGADSPGAAALDAHLDRAIGTVPSRRWHPRQAHARPGQGPLDQVVARAADGHWHLATYGLSEIDAKESDDPDVSGWGFELTLRVPDTGADDGPPDWAADLLTNLAVYVWTSRHPFAAGHHVALGGPLRPGVDSALTAAVVAPDPTVPPLRSGPFGSIEFLQIVGVTDDELEACRAWSTDGILDLLRRHDPLLGSDLGRRSILDDAAVRIEAEEHAARDGASLTELRAGTIEVRRRRGRATILRFGSGAATALGPALRRELIANGATFTAIGDDDEVTFAVGPPGWRTTEAGATVVVGLDAVERLASLFDGRTGWGHLDGFRGLRFQVIP